MKIAFTAAPFRAYTDTDILTIEDISLAARRVLLQIQKWDAMGKGAHGCFATVAVLAQHLRLTPASVKGHISRLHKKGYLAFIGFRGFGIKRLVARRVTLTGEPQIVPKPVMETLLAEKILAGEQSIAEAPAHMTIVSVAKKEVPTLEEYRAGRPFSGDQDGPVSDRVTSEDGPYSLKEKNKKEIPPFGGNSSSEISSQTSKPSTRGPQITPLYPADAGSHKKKDWLGLLQQKPFFDILKTRFPGFSAFDAKKLLSWLDRRGLPDAVVGYAIEHSNLLPKCPDFGELARPQTVVSFVQNFDRILDVVVGKVKDRLSADIECELTAYGVDGGVVVDCSVRHLEKVFRAGRGGHEWSEDKALRSYDLWPDLVWLVRKFDTLPDVALLLIPEDSRALLYERLAMHADAALDLCQQNNLNFADVFLISHEKSKADGLARKRQLEDQLRQVGEPQLWRPAAIAT
jgi:hypothetical protein